MFKQRLISGIILVLIAFVTLYYGGFLTFFVVGAISLIGVFELLRVIQMEKSALGVIVYTGSVLYYLLLLLGLEQYVMQLALLVLILLIAVYVFTFPKYEISSIAISYFALFYVTVMLSCIYRIRMLSDGAYMVVLVFLSAWGNDTLAYCTGRLIGKHKMSPILSPKKTIEGAVGGLISIIGDLGASAIKRNYDIKDYSHLIPGHGGILDRFDSIIFTAPIIYYMLVMVVGLK